MDLKAGFVILMARHGVKSRDVAKRTGKSIRSVQNLMAHGNPTVKSISELTYAIGGTLEELFHEAEKAGKS